MSVPAQPTREELQLVAGALIAACRDPGTDYSLDLHALVPADLVEIASRAAAIQGVGSAFHHALEASGIPAPAFLGAKRTLAAAQRIRIHSVLRTAAAALDTTDLRWLAFNGPIAAHWQRYPTLRDFGDLGILVAGRDLRKTLDTLAAEGAVSMNRNWERFLHHGVGRLPVRFDSVWINLRWSLVDLRHARQHVHLDVDDVIERRRMVAIDDVEIPTLDATDRMIRLCLDAGLVSAGRIGSLRDIHESVLADPPDWDELKRRIANGGGASVIGQILDRTRLTFDTPVPAELSEELVPRRRLAKRRALDASPAITLHQIYTDYLVATSRDRFWSTIAATAGFVKDRFLARLGKPARWDVNDEMSPLYWGRSSGGDAAKEQYLLLAAGRQESR